MKKLSKLENFMKYLEGNATLNFINKISNVGKDAEDNCALIFSEMKGFQFLLHKVSNKGSFHIKGNFAPRMHRFYFFPNFQLIGSGGKLVRIAKLLMKEIIESCG